ncbi:ATP synthase F1 subunit epsilon [Lacrimispora indolis]|uniref:ATP synthase F1 subunit epsilon n=1 Tax=Lacrimispora indolis TaxID=69825 RepID=UPI00045EC0AE|nr:ATP synthase F1 subunit epsilon [Lacrimispora indolis]
MADLFKLHIITPERKFYEGDASMVELTTTEGEIGVYRNHIPMTAIVAPGVLKIHEEGGVKEAALMSGFIEILPEKIVIMAEVAEWPGEIDASRAEEAKVRAERRLKEQSGEIDIIRAETALRKALIRLSLTK